MKHIICGFLLVGCFVRFNESDYVFGGLCDSPSKKKSWNALLLPSTRSVEGLKLISVALSKSILVPHGGIRFAEPDYLSHLERMLSEKTDHPSAITNRRSVSLRGAKSASQSPLPATPNPTPTNRASHPTTRMVPTNRIKAEARKLIRTETSPRSSEVSRHVHRIRYYSPCLKTGVLAEARKLIRTETSPRSSESGEVTRSPYMKFFSLSENRRSAFSPRNHP